jgi:hypothetical protein
MASNTALNMGLNTDGTLGCRRAHLLRAGVVEPQPRPTACTRCSFTTAVFLPFLSSSVCTLPVLSHLKREVSVDLFYI